MLTASPPRIVLAKVRLAPAQLRHYPAALLSLWCSTALAAERFLNGGFAKSRRSPLIAFLRFQRTVPLRATLPTFRVCFTPVTLLSFRLQGFRPPGDQSPSPDPFLPCRFTPNSAGAYDFEGLLPPRSRCEPESAHPCPPGVLPSEALPFAVVEPASRLLLSRAWRAPRPKPMTATCTTESRQAANPVVCSALPKEPNPYRPLWGSSPLRSRLPEGSRPRFGGRLGRTSLAQQAQL